MLRKRYLPILVAIGVLFSIGAEAAKFDDSVGVYEGTGSRRPSVKTDGSNVYVAYQLNTTDGPIHFKRSTDQGSNFLPSGNGTKVADGYGYFPRLDIDNAGKAYVVYTGLDGARYHPFGFKGTTSFASFLTRAITEDGSTQASMQGDVAVENISIPQNMYVVCDDDDTAALDKFCIFYTYSDDGGINWSGYDNLDEISTVAVAPARFPSIAVPNTVGSSDTAYVVWNSQNQFVGFSPVKNDGTHLGLIEDTTIGGVGVIIEGKPRIAATKIGEVYYLFAVWCDASGAATNVCFNYSVDGGANWGTPQLLAAPSDRIYNQDQPVIAVLPGTNHVYVAWRDDRDGADRIYFQEGELQSGNTAFTWGIDLDGDGDLSETDEQGLDLRADDKSGTQANPSIDARGVSSSPAVFVVWDNLGDPDAGVRCAKYVLEASSTSAPTNLSATGANGCVSLSWTASSTPNVTYSIYRSTERGSWPTSPTASGITATFHTDSGLTNGISYWYTATAVNADAIESGYSNDARATANIDTTPPSAPTGVAAAGHDRYVSLTWTKVSGAADYHIYRAASSGGPYKYVSGRDNSLEAKYNDYSLTNGTCYYYVITALGSTGNESADSGKVSATPSSPSTTIPAEDTPLRSAPNTGGCFIATAAFGTPLAYEVSVLSDFRDSYLLSHPVGKGLVKCYYTVSPPCARFITGRPFLKAVVRWELKVLMRLLGFREMEEECK